MNKQAQTNNGRIVLHDPQWYASGANLPAVRQASMPVNRMPAPIATPSTTTAGDAFTDADYKQLAIKVSGLMRQPLQSLRVLDCFRRVFLVEFVPHATVDPILPVTFVPLGQEHDDAFRRLAELIMSWDPDYTQHRQWYMQCKQYARPCLIAAFRTLTRDEAEWYAREMLFTLANPDRRNLNQPALTPEQQRAAQFRRATGRDPFYAWEK